MKKVNYSFIEASLTHLLQLLEGDGIELDRQDIQEFIDVGEYGLALETFVATVVEEKLNISKEAEILACQLAVDMGYMKSEIAEALRDFVS